MVTGRPSFNGSGSNDMNRSSNRITSFRDLEGSVIVNKYEVLELLGSGWEGEVYKLRERLTGIVLAGKFFFPERNRRDQALKFYAKKLHKLRACPILILYFTHEIFKYRGKDISFLASEYVDGELLTKFTQRQRGRRLSPFQGVHLLHALASGVEKIHQNNEYHGDLHPGNIIVQRHGLGFDLKLLDMYSWKAPKRENIQQDVIDMVRIFYDVVGGRRFYATQPPAVKQICCGLRHDLILDKFRNASGLRNYLETMEWS